jgi:hypothetical protein
MLPGKFDNLLENAIKENDTIYFEELKSWFDKKLEQLVNTGKIQFKDERFLGGIALEVRVRYIFNTIGLNVEFDKSIDSDGIIQPNESVEIKKPIVLEIKSSKSNGPTRTELRQLDDYIFEVSGEEIARKEGLGRGGIYFDPLAGILGSGLTKGKKYFHPSPHKGLIIFNNTEGNHFKNSFTIDLGGNEIEFVKKRDICVLSFKDFLEITNQIKDKKMTLNQFWTLIHETTGLLKQGGKSNS